MEKKSVFKPVQVSRISEYVEQKIRDAILDGRLKVGDRLPTEKEMAEQFGVSVVTLREALRALESYGFIEKRRGQGGGVYVAKLNEKSVKTPLGYYLASQHMTYQHLLDIRTILEPAVIRMVSDKITEDELQELEENVTYLEQRIRDLGPFLREEDFFDLDQRGVDFHRLLAKMTHNPILGLTVNYLFDFLYECEGDVLAPDVTFLVDNARDHRIILDLLKAHDGVQAERAMVDHLQAVNKTLAEMAERRLRSGEETQASHAFRAKMTPPQKDKICQT